MDRGEGCGTMMRTFLWGDGLSCECSTVAVRMLPKHDTGVRFPSLAHKLTYLFFGF